MRYMRLVLCTVLSLFSARATIANAQILSTTTRTLSTTTTPDSTIYLLTKRIEALESIVAQLQQKTAFIKSASPLMFDAGGDLSIRGGQVSVDAMSTFSLRAGAGASIRSGNQLLVEASSVLDLKGSSIRHNGGTAPVACAGS